MRRLALIAAVTIAASAAHAQTLPLLGAGGSGGGGLFNLPAAIIAQGGTNTPHTNAAMASPPTITPNGHSKPGSMTQVFTFQANPTLFQYYGGHLNTPNATYVDFPSPTVVVPPANSTCGGAYPSADGIAWRVYARINSAQFSWGIGPSGANGYRFIVNNQYVSFSPSSPTDSSGAVDYFTLDFTSAGGKAIRDVVVEGVGCLGFNSINLQAGDAILTPAQCFMPGTGAKYTAIDAGDSITGATGTAFEGDGYARQYMERMGFCDAWMSGVGGSGFVANTGGATLSLPNRLFDVNGFGANLIIVAMGVNDAGQSDASIIAAAQTSINSFRTNNPLAPIIAIGPFNKNAPSAPVAGNDAVEADIVTAMTGVANSYFISVRNVQYQPTSAGNVHPSTQGHSTLAAFLFWRTLVATNTAVGFNFLADINGNALLDPSGNLLVN